MNTVESFHILLTILFMYLGPTPPTKGLSYLYNINYDIKLGPSSHNQELQG